MADYLSTVRGIKQRQTITKYGLSEHYLAVEKGRPKRFWQPRENRICGHCLTDEVETEVHFLLKYKKFDKTRKTYFDKLSLATPDFKELDDISKLRIILGEGNTAHLGAQYVTACPNLRDGE